MTEEEDKLLNERIKQNSDAIAQFSPEFNDKIRMGPSQIIQKPFAAPDAAVQNVAAVTGAKVDLPSPAKYEQQNKERFEDLLASPGDDLNGDGIVTEDEKKHKDLVAAEEAEDVALANIGIERNENERLEYSSTQFVDANLYSSTMRTSVDFANKSIATNTQNLVKQLNKNAEQADPDKRFTKEEQKDIVENVDKSLGEAYKNILDHFKDAIDGKEEKDFKEFDKLIDDIKYLGSSEKNDIKQNFREMSPEQRNEFLKKAMEGDEAHHISGISEKEKEFFEKSTVSADSMRKLAAENNESVGACFGANCQMVADSAFRANLVSLSHYAIEERKPGATINKDVNVEVSQNYNFEANITNKNILISGLTINVPANVAEYIHNQQQDANVTAAQGNKPQQTETNAQQQKDANVAYVQAQANKQQTEVSQQQDANVNYVSRLANQQYADIIKDLDLKKIQSVTYKGNVQIVMVGSFSPSVSARDAEFEKEKAQQAQTGAGRGDN
jgi:hypothetical protein